MPRLRLLAILAAGLVLALASLPAVASAKRSCGTVTKTYSYGSYRFAIKVEIGHVSCTTARAVMRRALVRNHQVKGWTCFNPPASTGVDKVCGQPKDAQEDFSRAISARLLH